MLNKNSRFAHLCIILIGLCYLGSCGPFLDYCSTIPYNMITKCNMTCATCLSRNQCSTCPSYLTLSGGSCTVPTSERITHTQYFTQQNLQVSKDLLSFKNAQGILGTQNVFRFCIDQKYRFDIIGLFSNQNELKFSQSYLFQASQIALNFRLFYSTTIAILKIYINEKLVYNKTLDSGFILNYSTTGSSPQRDSAQNQWNIGKIQFDPTSYVDQIFASIQTGMIPLSSTYANIKIVVLNGSTTTTGTQSDKFWGISELNVVTKKCRTCVSDSIKRLSAALGITIGISTGMILLLLLILHITSKIKTARYRKNLKKRFYKSHEKIINTQRYSAQPQ